MHETRRRGQNLSAGNGRAGKVRLLVADASRMNCQLLITALRRYHRIRVTARATTSEEVLGAVRSDCPNVALISASLQDGSLSGFSVVRQLRLQHPEVRPILLLDSAEHGLVIDAFRAGAKGILCREDSLPSLCKCIEAVQAGQIWANSSQLESVLEAFARVAPPRLIELSKSAPLSKREQEVAQLVSEGLSNRDIAQRLRLSEHTVKNYMFHIFEKLGISSRVELVLFTHAQQHSPENLSAPAEGSPAGSSERRLESGSGLQ
jgi:DNA-binding NarL/FixJ family response regulator